MLNVSGWGHARRMHLHAALGSAHAGLRRRVTQDRVGSLSQRLVEFTDACSALHEPRAAGAAVSLTRSPLYAMLYISRSGLCTLSLEAERDGG